MPQLPSDPTRLWMASRAGEADDASSVVGRIPRREPSRRRIVRGGREWKCLLNVGKTRSGQRTWDFSREQVIHPGHRTSQGSVH